MAPRTDAALKSAADELRTRIRDVLGTAHNSILVPAFALVYESARRVHGLELFDTQLLAGAALARGAIAEMATGEGKTWPPPCRRYSFAVRRGRSRGYAQRLPCRARLSGIGRSCGSWARRWGSSTKYPTRNRSTLLTL